MGKDLTNNNYSVVDYVSLFTLIMKVPGDDLGC